MKAPDRYQRLQAAQLYVLIDGGANREAFAEYAQVLVEAGVDMLQLRDKRLSDRALLARARLLRERTRASRTLMIINDRPDIALLADADGVHVGQEELPVADVRQLVGREMIIGLSTHSLEQIEQAALCQADYIGCGPVFPSTTKEFTSFPGLELLAQASGRLSIPAFAIGGVTRHNLPLVLDRGCTRIAVQGAVTGAADPADEVRQLRRMLKFE